MGFRVAEEAAGFAGTFVDFTVGRKPGGYAADERRSTHPVAAIAEDVADVDLAAGNFDSISYAKGNSVLRQLVTWLGDDAFLAGVNAYLTRHRFGNATLADFVDALDAVTDRDVRAWVAALAADDRLRHARGSPATPRTRAHPRGQPAAPGPVTSYDESLAAARQPAAGRRRRAGPAAGDAAVVVPNSAGETFARIRLDRALVGGRRARPRLDPRRRRPCGPVERRLSTWCGAASCRPTDFLGLVTRHLPREPARRIVEWVLCLDGLDAGPPPPVAGRGRRRRRAGGRGL